MLPLAGISLFNAIFMFVCVRRKFRVKERLNRRVEVLLMLELAMHFKSPVISAFTLTLHPPARIPLQHSFRLDHSLL